MGKKIYSEKYTERESIVIDIGFLIKNCLLKGSVLSEIEIRGQRVRVLFDALHNKYVSFSIQEVLTGYQSFSLVNIPCNLGGHRWAFKCAPSCFYNGCGRKFYKLYKTPESAFFGCRKCMNIIYSSQIYSNSRFSHLYHRKKNSSKIQKLASTIHKQHYKGLPTKKVQKLNQLIASYEAKL